MNVRPLRDRIIVKRIEADKVSKGGIIIPDMAKEKPVEGEVIAVGPGKRLDNGRIQEPSVKVGDHVLFGKYSGAEVKAMGSELLFINEDDVLGIIER